MQTRRARLRGRAVTGFTLIEVMITVAIVGILAAIAVPAYGEVVNRGRRAEGRNALLLALQAQERFYVAQRRFSEFSPATPNGFSTTSGESPADAHYVLSAQACAGTTADVCVVISATPAGSAVPAGGSGFVDSRCGTLTLSTAGPRAPADCW